MLKNLACKSLILLYVLLHANQSFGADGCEGKFPNPITDVCWLCMFPINIGGFSLTVANQQDSGPKPPLLCACPAPAPIFIRPGIGVSYWEPARVSEVVRTPMCFPTLNGTKIGTSGSPRGTHSKTNDETGQAFYQVHWLQYPILNWLGIVISQGACLVNETFDVAYISEFDPLWDDDELSFLINPEAALFANVPAQAACVADSVKAATTGFGIDSLFWCSGSQGSLYPLSGSQANHIGGIDSSLVLTHKMIYKLHRQFIAQDTSTRGAMCMTRPQPIMRKNQYKTQLLYPIPYNYKAFGFGATSIIWGAGREFPYKGEDFSYLVWRKRMCCAF